MPADPFPSSTEGQHLSRTPPGPLPEPIMSLSYSCDGSATVVTVSGEIDMSNAHLLVELVESLCRATAPTVTLDLSAVTYFGAHGISALLHAHELVTAVGGRLAVGRASSFVLYVLGVTGVRSHLELGVTAPSAAPIAPVVTRAPLPRPAGGRGRPAARVPFAGVKFTEHRTTLR
ncbi:STAS domain-containing protein [Micromonospora coxensis]|uniref:Anti-sigma factor antagonist n=1 Tax=Micromonospora coxensis TaxID=356852 RepID=A0A1C5K1R0_9ACTN|nr:STAS domain-containing protein [Micromonospora coxensis]SCG76511.1 anti-anti-sigma factor [Micromonospora coxensis]